MIHELLLEKLPKKLKKKTQHHLVMLIQDPPLYPDPHQT